MRNVPQWISRFVLVTGLLVTTSVFADYAEVNRLLRANQLAEAIAKADQFLLTKPKDPQMRFLKGVILTEQNKPQDAIAMFTKLIEEYPELPEPYNNLAVLQAGLGQFDKARAALEMAIRTNPSYATAHENLGDVYAKLASQAYTKALQLDASNTAVQPKLGLIRDLFAPAGKNARPPAVATATVPAVNVPAQPPTKPASAATPTPTPTPSPPPSVATTKPTATPTTPTQAASAATSGSEDSIRAAVQAWASAWSSRDMKAYFAAYGKDFSAPGGRSAWEEERRQRILGKSKISVQVSNLEITVNGAKAQARFRQSYAADTLSVNSRKTLDLALVDNRWVIVREVVGG